MKSLNRSAAAILLAACGLASSGRAQAPRGPAPVAEKPASPTYPAPTNLKVLPKDSTGLEVQRAMERWQRSLGTHCDSCHAENAEAVGPDGKPLLNYASDAKPMKAVARAMVAMTEEINRTYLARIDTSGVPVTCGTCHRGHLGPEPFPAPPAQLPAPPPLPPSDPDESRPQR